MVPADTPKGSGATRARRPRPERRLEVAVSWADVADTVRAIVATAPDEPTGHRLARGLTQPLAVLQELVDLTARADEHDDDARTELRERITRFSALAEFGATRPARDPKGCCCHGCGCGDGADGGCDCRGGDHRGADRDIPEDAQGAEPGGAAPATLDEQGLVVFAQLVLRALAEAPTEERATAIDTLTALILSAAPLAAVVEGWRRDGADGVTTRIADLARTGLLDWVRPAQPQQVRSAGAPMGMPGLPGGGLPGLPGGGRPGLPGGGLPGVPGGRGPTIEDLLGSLKKPPKVWDPDDWCPVFVIGPRLDFIDPRPIAWIRCLLAVLRILRDRAALLPPARPARVVWSDGITALETAGACAGDTLTVVGQGFPNRNQAVLLLPFADGCRPVNVTAANWSNRRITVTLPAGIVSGPVGFADRAYVEAYDAWVAEQNRLADLANGYRCYAPVAWLPGFRECPPETPVNRLRAGQPIIEAFTANGAVDAVITTGQGISLAWTVRNAEQVRLARVSAAGPLFGSATSVTNPAGTSWWFGPQSVSAPTTYTYRLTVTGPCGEVTRDVRIAVSKRPALRIESVEVTQSIQTIPHSTRLVRWKPTVVRVTVRHGLAGFGGGVVPNVRGRIQVRPAAGQWSPWFDAANGTSPIAPSSGSSITVRAAPQRNTTDDTLNFLIPPGWNTGTASYRIEVRVAGYGGTSFFAGFDEQTSMTTGSFTFEPRRIMDLRYVRVNWNGSTPTDATCRATLRAAIPLLPTPTASITALAGVGVQSGSTLDDRDDLLDDFDDRHNCSLWEALTEWLGSDCPDDDGAIWVLIPGVFVRGRAYDIPSNVCFTPPNDGPYAAHELAHCLDQEHVSVMCSNGQQATGGDAPGDWPNNAQLVDVPFDVTRNAALSLAGTGVFDVMSYCGTPNNTWPMPIRYARLWDQVGG